MKAKISAFDKQHKLLHLLSTEAKQCLTHATKEDINTCEARYTYHVHFERGWG